MHSVLYRKCAFPIKPHWEVRKKEINWFMVAHTHNDGVCTMDVYWTKCLPLPLPGSRSALRCANSKAPSGALPTANGGWRYCFSEPAGGIMPEGPWKKLCVLPVLRVKCGISLQCPQFLLITGGIKTTNQIAACFFCLSINCKPGKEALSALHCAAKCFGVNTQRLSKEMRLSEHN